MKIKEPGKLYVTINIRVIPKSSRNEIIKEEGGLYKVKVTSPPVDGKANKAVISLLSKKIRVSKGNIEIISGEKSRDKKIRIHGISEDEFSELIG